ncbi:pimeloyl-ACP methyl ester carboxylesterase [Actinoplanes tereljensis]|uniref:Alpha/beta hydrolase n=1 Tax=Paractinoplanes tereljensis TaxID=571912 RepID=A0A919TR12_9ACTN|nr:alpha/beta hydrolase [Actinoplanes tereljensis]GIF17945.1 alpha/beta hydrolase [Actinoplanes tereljensis]
MESVKLPDGRVLEYLVEGPADGLPLVLHHGTPGGAVSRESLFPPGVRVVMISRPGYATSTPLPGRRVADAAADTAAVLDAIGIAEFVTVGWSGGGPHALACAALLPDRCLAAATIAGVAPYGVEGLDWFEGMGAENIEEFGKALAGPAELEASLAEAEGSFAQVQPDEVIAAFGDLVSEVDKRALADGFAEYLARSLRHALSGGTAGWRDDDLAFCKPWGFDVAGIEPPVSLWQGDQDRMVPYGHGRWLAAHLPQPEVHLVPGEGHISLVNNMNQIVETLRRQAAV